MQSIQGGDQLLTLMRDIEANPLRADMVEDAATYRWSSHAGRVTRAIDPPSARQRGVGHRGSKRRTDTGLPDTGLPSKYL